MTSPIDRFNEMVNSGEIRDMEPLPRVFDFRELEYLYNAGYIISSGGSFLAVVI